MAQYRIFLRTGVTNGGGSGGGTTGTDRNSLVLGTYKPDDTTTGIIAGTSLTVVNSAFTPAANTTYQNMDFRAYMSISAANVTFKNCFFRGGDPSSLTGDKALAQCTSGSCLNAVFEDCTFAATTPSAWVNGIMGHDFTARRCNFYQVTDCIQIYNTNNSYGSTATADDVNVVVEGSYLHDMVYWYPDLNSSHTDGTHNDGIQLQAGGNIKVFGNNIQGFRNQNFGTPTGGPYAGNQTVSCMLIKPDVDYIDTLNITNNYIDGGAFSININNRASGPTRNLGNIGIIKNNKFGHNQRQQGSSYDATYTISMPSNVVCDTGDGTSQQNVYEDDGNPIVVRHNG